MILEKGNIWTIYGKTDLFCITTNSIIRSDGGLVMGKGIARQAKEKLPKIDFYLGQKIKYFSRYGLIIIDNYCQLIGAFQTKVDWRDKSSLPLISYSTQKLREYLLEFKPNRIDLPFPGIGYGGLNKNEVLPILVLLPDSVHIWEFV